MADIVKMLKALSDENRFTIFNIVLKGETCACELLKELDIAQPTLSRHMRVLVDSGLISARKDAQWMRYSVNREALSELVGYFGSINADEIPLVNPSCGCR